MKEMFEASVDGEAFDMERWGQYFKPAGMGAATGDPNKPAATTRAAAPVDDDEPPFEADPPKASAPAPSAETNEGGNSNRAQDILKAIRARQGQ